MVVKIDAGDGAFPHADRGASVAGDEAAEKLKQDGVMADGEHAFAAGILNQHVLEGGKVCIGQEGSADFDLGVIAELGSDKLGGLHGALERAGDDDVDLDLEGAQHAGHQHALVLAFLDEAPLGVESGILSKHSCTGVTHQVEDHSESFGGEPVRWSSGTRRRDFNMSVTIQSRQVGISGLSPPAGQRLSESLKSG